nr:MAG TPA: hypothetical protein [Caudoviricetes sp.]
MSYAHHCTHAAGAIFGSNAPVKIWRKLRVIKNYIFTTLAFTSPLKNGCSLDHTTILYIKIFLLWPLNVPLIKRFRCVRLPNP